MSSFVSPVGSLAFLGADATALEGRDPRLQRDSISRRRSRCGAGMGVFLRAISMVLVLLGATVTTATAQAAITAAISTPAADQVLRGLVQVEGTADALNFASAELAFSYGGDSTNTWFVIQELDQPVLGGALAAWDTNSISDGEYVLRLRVRAQDGNYQDVTVAVQVRNYTSPPADAPTPVPTQAPVVEIPSPMVLAAPPTATALPEFTPTPLPPNPGATTTATVYDWFRWGGLVAVGMFVIVAGLLLRRRS